MSPMWGNVRMKSKLHREARTCPLNNLACQWEYCQWFIRIGSRPNDMSGDCAIVLIAKALMMLGMNFCEWSESFRLAEANICRILANR